MGFGEMQQALPGHLSISQNFSQLTDLQRFVLISLAAEIRKGIFKTYPLRSGLKHLCILQRNFLTTGMLWHFLDKVWVQPQLRLLPRIRSFQHLFRVLYFGYPIRKSDFSRKEDVLAEEEGEKYNTKFWREANEMDFFASLNEYNGGIHLVYGETDKYVSAALRKKTIALIKKKNQQYMILPEQDHSPWAYALSQKVFSKELRFLKQYVL
jgi:hypothetical protein